MPSVPLWTIVAAPLLGGLICAALASRAKSSRVDDGRALRAAISAVACCAVGGSLVAGVLASWPLFAVTFGAAPAQGPAALAAAVAGNQAAGLLSPQAAASVDRWVTGMPYVRETLYTWIDTGGIALDFSLWLDPLSVLMVLVITSVGLLIHLYAAAYMADERDLGRFFCYLNLFCAAMLLLVLGDGLMTLFVGWEGVGACSYLLIGFWYDKPANGAAARKAFIVTRIGDAAFLLAMLVLAWNFGTLRIAEILERVTVVWQPGHPIALAVAGLLLLAALGKSAQVPLQIWLPDAMAGPTPVSALLHAATMVTAGVYLIARCHTLFLFAPAVLAMIATLGTITAISAACSALGQRDIKRVLAYSTISQIGFMFTALGVGAFVAAMFHFFTHAFFKALLFLSAGSVTHSLDGETDITRMGGLARRLPMLTMLAGIGAAALAGVPLVTSGFYSKDQILWGAYQAPIGNAPMWAVLVLTAAITALYSMRWYLLVFWGEGASERAADLDVDVGSGHSSALHRPSRWLLWTCVPLAVGALFAGFVQTPERLGGVHAFEQFIGPAFLSPGGLTLRARSDGEGSALAAEAEHALELRLMSVSSAAVVAGLLLGFWLYFLNPGIRRLLRASPILTRLRQVWAAGWFADEVADAMVGQTYTTMALLLRSDPADRAVLGGARGVGWAHRLVARTQTGRLQTYVAALLLGVLALLTVWLWSELLPLWPTGAGG